ncbi:LemA family protein [Candidatus Dojkabacteria bacterium]|nr:LemA family protein [Candidatus Dojkabacteria bacterium]
MSGLLLILLILGGGVLFLVLIVVVLYNSIARLKILVDEAWSGIDVQLKRRYDLIPNLVETVKGYAKHERKTFEKIAELRTSAMNANSPEEKGKVENQLTGALKTLFAVAENYPQLKANENFLNLQVELSGIEGELQGARRYYNGAVRDFNTKIVLFPNNIIAGMLGFKIREFFEAEEGEKQNVKVDFSETDESEK